MVSYAAQERNREHAKRSRIRKKFMLECLQEQLLAMRKQNLALRQVLQSYSYDACQEITLQSCSK